MCVCMCVCERAEEPERNNNNEKKIECESIVCIRCRLERETDSGQTEWNIGCVWTVYENGERRVCVFVCGVPMQSYNANK